MWCFLLHTSKIRLFCSASIFLTRSLVQSRGVTCNALKFLYVSSYLYESQFAGMLRTGSYYMLFQTPHQILPLHRCTRRIVDRATLFAPPGEFVSTVLFDMMQRYRFLLSNCNKCVLLCKCLGLNAGFFPLIFAVLWSPRCHPNLLCTLP